MVFSLLQKIKKHPLILGCTLIGLIYLLPRLLLQEASYICIFDQLDGLYTYIKLLADKVRNLEFFTPIAQVMTGVPRISIGCGNPFLILLFVFLKPFSAYIVNELVLYLVGFCGVYLLLSEHILNKKEYRYIVWGVSICFSFIPLQTMYGLSLVGQPLLLYAFLNIRKRGFRRVDALIIGLFSFYSIFILSGLYMAALFGFIIVRDILIKKKMNAHSIWAVLLFILGYLISEWQLFYFLVKPLFVTHRSYFVNPQYSMSKVVEIVRDIVFFDKYMVASWSFPQIIMPLAIGSIVVAKIRLKQKDRLTRLLIYLLAGIILGAFFQVCVGKWDGLYALREQLPFFKTFLFRFTFLRPILVVLCFAVSLCILQRCRVKRAVIIGIMGLQFLSIIFFQLNTRFINYELVTNYSLLAHKYFNIKSIGRLDCEKMKLKTVSRFFSESLFQDISRYIGKPASEYRVGCLGFYPSIAQYNGFYTIGGYASLYPLTYKNKFYKIIESELEKPTGLHLKNKFKSWGNRCYLYFAGSRDTIYYYPKWMQNSSSIELSYNMNAFKSLGGEYLLSAKHISNAKENQLTLLKVFENAYSPYRIYLYGVALST